MDKTSSIFARQAQDYMQAEQGLQMILWLVLKSLLKVSSQHGFRRDMCICGNGGSAANAIHIANDMHFWDELVAERVPQFLGYVSKL